ncbi:MAG: hypothetical protein WCQ00_02380 [bacterium]
MGRKVEVINLLYVTDKEQEGDSKVVVDPFEALGLEEIPITHDEIVETLRDSGYRLASRVEAGLIVGLLRERGEKRKLICNDEDEDKWFVFHSYGFAHNQFEDKEDERLIRFFFFEERTAMPEDDYVLICIRVGNHQPYG